ncbi:alpha/beta fold hydrolase [Actinoplanes couchii]|uniref:AB hydrolase-1 domain-containing protein n=1 Tax=Actinoplanes couchii TaxID=403638 RepID=A0ABQ3XU19_9ACTN|nr:alpha/beta fold hydrolase [Actinoplanes couchii]MDR6318512.1 alpha-beta hydrolase superfamily lysophospholipase [Actinoplanes couchii]GID61955.1 hypothetical protein Aco03nite_103590 [Actinoplanes couchii]
MKTLMAGVAAALIAAVAFVVPAAASAGDRVPAGFTEQKVQVGSVDINYVRAGHGPTLVLVHGYPQTWYGWHKIMPALAERYTVIAPDLRGAGKSDAPAGDGPGGSCPPRRSTSSCA